MLDLPKARQETTIRMHLPRLSRLINLRLLVIHCAQYLALQHKSENIGAAMSMRWCRAVRGIADLSSDDCPFRRVGKCVLVHNLNLGRWTAVTQVSILTLSSYGAVIVIYPFFQVITGDDMTGLQV